MSIPRRVMHCRDDHGARSRRAWRAYCGMVLIWATTAVHAETAETTHPGHWAQLVSVRELLQLDTAEALRRARDQAPERSVATRVGVPSMAEAPALSLLAIYGVGHRLLAEIRLGNDRLVYLKGQPLPVGANRSLPEHVPRLVAIDGTCVRMTHQAREHTVCLQR